LPPGGRGRAVLHGGHTPIFFRERKRVRPKESQTVSGMHSSPVAGAERTCHSSLDALRASVSLQNCQHPRFAGSSAARWSAEMYQ